MAPPMWPSWPLPQDNSWALGVGDAVKVGGNGAGEVGAGWALWVGPAAPFLS